MKKWTKYELKYAIILIKIELSYKDISKILNRTEKSIQRKLNDLGYKSTYKKKLYEEKKCKYCSKEFISLKKENKKFCNKKCSINFLNENKIFDYQKIKLSKCVICKCDVEVKNNTNYTRIMCNKCKHEHNKKHCKYCGSEIKNNYKRKVCDDCKIYSFNIPLYKKLNIYIEKNKKLSFLNKKAVDILSYMYYDKKYSRLQICNMFNIDKKSLYKFLIKNNFKLRTRSQSISNAIYQGRLKFGEINNQYKSGWHKTWENNNVYYRSSYELNYCKLLDNKRIRYIMENKRIRYWDSILNKERIAIPDFYLIDTNEIVEIKSNWTYDEQNMKDKIKSYKNNSYNVKLIIENDEYNINPCSLIE